MKHIREMDLGELAAFVCSHLMKNGIKCVLTGGACVCIYTNYEIISYDLDFIEMTIPKSTSVKHTLEKIGFYPHNRYYHNENTIYFIEFPPGPLAIGSEIIKKANEKIYPTGTLYLLNPTDCVKDRLAAYFYWDDLQSLNQAIAVAKNNDINFLDIEEWSKNENQYEKYIGIKGKLIKK